MADRFLILESDKLGTTWPRIERHLKERLDELRVQNDAFSLDETKTAALRGRIAEITALLSAAQEIPPPIDFG